MNFSNSTFYLFSVNFWYYLVLWVDHLWDLLMELERERIVLERHVLGHLFAIPCRQFYSIHFFRLTLLSKVLLSSYLIICTFWVCLLNLNLFTFFTSLRRSKRHHVFLLLVCTLFTFCIILILVVSFVLILDFINTNNASWRRFF